MNKTIIININGVVFHIEEDAYEMLRTYMWDVKKHFAYSADHDEIVTDIENRLAEMFTERLQTGNKQVIVLNDVQEITGQMGSVADFGTAEDDTFSESRMRKKLFRDTDDRMLGGVCSGLGHYLDIEARWIRLFILLLVFLGGSGVMLYIILWVVMPPARSRTDKMAMKGEPINLQNFKKTFDEEVENFRQGISRAHDDTAPALREFAKSLAGILKLSLKIVGSVLIFAEAMGLLALIVALTLVLGLGNALQVGPIPPVFDPEYRPQLAIAAFLVLSIPLITLILLEIRLLFNRKLFARTGVFIMLLIWIAGIAGTAYYGAKTGMQFTEKASVADEIALQRIPVYFLKINSGQLSHDPTLLPNTQTPDQKTRRRIHAGDRDFDYLKNIQLVIERSANDQTTLTRDFSSRGADFEGALQSARKITYHVQQRDSLLYFDHSLQIGNSLFRDQKVKMTLYVPENTKLVIDRELYRFIREFNLWDCESYLSTDKSASQWLMTPNGLKCLDSVPPRQEGQTM